MKGPRRTRLADRVLSPLIGKSFVIYVGKPGSRNRCHPTRDLDRAAGGRRSDQRERPA